MIEPIARDLLFRVPDGVGRDVKILPAHAVADRLEFLRVERASTSCKRDERGGEKIGRTQILPMELHPPKYLLMIAKKSPYCAITSKMLTSFESSVATKREEKLCYP